MKTKDKTIDVLSAMQIYGEVVLEAVSDLP